MIKNITIVLIVILFVSLSAEQYSLDELIETGLSQSYNIKEAKTSLSSSKSSYRSSWYGLLPYSSINYSNINSEQFVDEITTKTERKWVESASLSLSKSISLNEPSYYNIRTSLYSLRNSELSYEDSRRSIAYTIFSSYLYVLEAQKSLEINQENLKLQQRIHDQIRVQYETGEKSLLDLKQSEITLIDYEIAVNESSNNLVQQRRDLFTYLNMEDEGFDLIEPEFVEYGDFDLTFYSNNTLLQKKNSLKSSKLSHFQTKMNFLPTLTFGYSYGASSPGDDIHDYSNYNDSYTFSLTASYDIFDIFKVYEDFEEPDLRSNSENKVSQAHARHCDYSYNDSCYHYPCSDCWQ